MHKQYSQGAYIQAGDTDNKAISAFHGILWISVYLENQITDVGVNKYV